MARFPPHGALLLVLTHRCNLRCVYCYETRRTRGVMDPGVLDAGIERLLAGRRRAEVLLSGGEPLLARPLVERALAHRARAAADGKDLVVSLLTNGTRIDGGILDRVESGDLHLQVSLDGPAQVRRLHGRDPGMRPERALATLRSLSPAAQASRVEVAAAVARSSFRHLARSVDYLLAEGRYRVSVTAVDDGTGPWSGEDERDLRAVMRQVRRVAARRRVRPGGDRLGLFPGPRAPRIRRGHAHGGPRCGAPAGACVSVDVDGTIAPCPMLLAGYRADEGASWTAHGPSLPAVSILSDGAPEEFRAQLRALGENAIFRPRPNRRAGPRRCADCTLRGACFVCPMAGHSGAGRLDDPDEVPEFLCAFTRALAAARR